MFPLLEVWVLNQAEEIRATRNVRMIAVKALIPLKPVLYLVGNEAKHEANEPSTRKMRPSVRQM